MLQHYQGKFLSRAGWRTDFELVADPHRCRIYMEKGERISMIHNLDTDGVSLRCVEEHIAEFGLSISECRDAAKLFAAA